MEIEQELGARGHVNAAHGIALGFQMRLQPFDVKRAGLVDQLAQHLAFDHAAHGENLACLDDRRLGHEGATRRLQPHQLELRQADQRLPHDGARHAKAVADGLLDQLGAGLQAVFDDGPCHCGHNDFGAGGFAFVHACLVHGRQGVCIDLGQSEVLA